MMNPHVAMMGNMDLGARIKVDYATLTYVSNQTKLETNTGNNQKKTIQLKIQILKIKQQLTIKPMKIKLLKLVIKQLLI